MKYRTELLSAFFLFNVATAAFAASSPVHDATLTTLDRNCAIHYLSHGNTTGWYLTDVDGSCVNGFLDGEGSAVIRNAFGREVGQMFGFFTQGYWTGSTPIPAILKKLYLGSDDTQTLSFDLGKEERLDIQYIGKMEAARLADGTYGPFMGCEPAYILAHTSDMELFSDKDVQHELINAVINRIQAVCPRVNQIYFYASDKENPESQDIAFFADINLGAHQIRVRRLPSSSRLKDILTDPTDRTPAIPLPREVRHENALPIVQVKPVKSEPELEERTVPEAITEITIQPAQVPPPPQETPPLISSPLLPDEPVVAASQNSPTLPEPVYLDAIPNLLTAARLLKQPVSGKALVRVDRFDEDGYAVVEEPVHLKIHGSGVSLGWGIIEGMFSYTPPAGGLTDIRGTVQLKSFTPYTPGE